MELERKVVSLESEVKVMKGEVRKLLIDLREIMNKRENPFYRVKLLPDQRTESSTEEEISRKTIEPSETIEEKEYIKQEKSKNSAYSPENSDQENTFPPSSPHNVQPDLPVLPGYETGPHPDPMQALHNGSGMTGTPGFNSYPDRTQDRLWNSIPENSEEALWAHRRMTGLEEMQANCLQNYRNNGEGERDNSESEKSKGRDDSGFGIETGNSQFDRAFNPETFSPLKPGRKADIFMLIELMRWTDYTLKTIKKEKLQDALDLYEFAGYLPEHVKTLILKIINLSYQDEGQEYRAGMRDYIRAITQLNTILNPGEMDSRLMHFVFEDMPWRGEEHSSQESSEERI